MLMLLSALTCTPMQSLPFYPGRRRSTLFVRFRQVLPREDAADIRQRISTPTGSTVTQGEFDEE